MVNQSKLNDPRFLAEAKSAGAVGTVYPTSSEGSPVKKFYLTEEDFSRFDFENGRTLLLVPFANKDVVAGLDAVVLYQGTDLQALSMQEEYGGIIGQREGGGFFSKGQVTQQELAFYWQAAIDVAQRLMEDYSNKKISDRDWERKYRRLWGTSTENPKTRAGSSTVWDDLRSGVRHKLEKVPQRLERLI